jgi:SAM-dependent methyltransferase
MRRPRFIAEQARHAHGLLGRVIAFIMARETWGENERAMAALDLKPSDHVIDIGCGHGRALAALAARAAHVVGADPSDLMTEIAVTRNRDLVKAGKVQVMIAAAADLPFEARAFDKALCVHVIYFWKDLRTCFREIARVMTPNGRFVLVFRTDADEAAVAAFPADVYSFRPLSEVAAALDDAGFAVDAELLAQQEGKSPALLVATKREAARTSVVAIESRGDQHAR